MNKLIQFSGGKDSLACLHLYRDDPGAVALYIDTGETFPHVKEFVRDSCLRMGVELVIRGPKKTVLEWQSENGMPADIVPWDATPEMRWASKEPFGPPLVPYSTCCSHNIWAPMVGAVKSLGVKEVVRGSKKCDSHVGVTDGYTDDGGVKYISPLWDWTDADVFSYLKENSVDIPAQYEAGADSLDCWCCTAYMDGHGQARFAYMKDNYPELYAMAKPRMDSVSASVRAAVAHYNLEV